MGWSGRDYYLGERVKGAIGLLNCKHKIYCTVGVFASLQLKVL